LHLFPLSDWQRRKETPNPLVVDPLALQITTPGYHGYGIIGGIMAFDLKKLAGIPFENVWMTTLRRFVDNQKQDFGYDWFPRLNDQVSLHLIEQLYQQGDRLTSIFYSSRMYSTRSLVSEVTWPTLSLVNGTYSTMLR